MGTTLGEWLCLLLPWHKYKIARRLSGPATLVECLHCKRLWAMNHDICAVLPWHSVKEFYDQLDRDIDWAVSQANPAER